RLMLLTAEPCDRRLFYRHGAVPLLPSFPTRRSSDLMIAWVVTPSGRFVAAALGVAGVLHAGRLVRWAGHRTVSDRLVLVLHVAYAFVPAGFLLAALSAVDLVAPGAGIHAWTGGAIGSMTI